MGAWHAAVSTITTPNAHTPLAQKKEAIKMLIDVAKKPQNAGALNAANTDVTRFEEAVRVIYN